MSKSRIAALLFFALILVSLLTSLTPFTDIDHDGMHDSLITEGLILLPVFVALNILNILFSLVFPGKLSVPRLCTARFTPPPIFN